MSEHRDYLAARLRRAGSQLLHLPRVLGLLWTAARGWSLAWAGLLTLQGLLPAAQVYLIRALVDQIEAAGRARVGASSPRQTLALAALLAATLVASEVLRAIGGWARE